jgi:hypothetical protein
MRFPEIALLFFRAMWSSFHAGGKGIQAAERENWKAVSNFKELCVEREDQTGIPIKNAQTESFLILKPGAIGSGTRSGTQG